MGGWGSDVSWLCHRATGCRWPSGARGVAVGHGTVVPMHPQAVTAGQDRAILCDSKPSPLGLSPHLAVVSLSTGISDRGTPESCILGGGTAQCHCHHHRHCPGWGVTRGHRNRTEADSIKNLSFISLLAAIPSA